MDNKSESSKKTGDPFLPCIVLLIPVAFFVFWIIGQSVNQPTETEYDRANAAAQERVAEEERKQRWLDRKCETLNDKLKCELCTLTEDEKATAIQCMAKRIKTESPYLVTPQGASSEIDLPRPESKKAQRIRPQVEAEDAYWHKKAAKVQAEGIGK